MAGIFYTFTDKQGQKLLERAVNGSEYFDTYYYDNLGQVIKEVKSNLLGGHDTTETVYTFSGKPATVTHEHTATGKTTRTEVYNYTYDGKNRLTKVTHKLGNNTVNFLYK